MKNIYNNDDLEKYRQINGSLNDEGNRIFSEKINNYLKGKTQIKSEIVWIPCEERMPSDDRLDHFLVIVREKWNNDEDYIYNVDYATNHGDYIDNYWNTYNDWKEGQEVHITHWAEIPNPFLESQV